MLKLRHREIGVHVTQMRSIDLDKWKPEWVENVRRNGNIKVNAQYHARLPDNYTLPTKKDGQEQTQKLQNYIRAKYEQKRWFGTPTETSMAQAKARRGSRSGSIGKG